MHIKISVIQFIISNYLAHPFTYSSTESIPLYSALPLSLLILSHRMHQLAAVLYMLTSSTSLVLMQLFFKMLAQQLTVNYIIYCRSLAIVLFNCLVIFRSKDYEGYGDKAVELRGVERGVFRFNIKDGERKL